MNFTGRVTKLDVGGLFEIYNWKIIGKNMAKNDFRLGGTMKNWKMTVELQTNW